ncbi:MAG: hypothetical protein AAFR70_00175 [Pseudomonadota bacterium]
MRLINLIAALCAAMIFSAGSATSAEAGGIDRLRAPAGWGVAQHAHRYVYRPRYRFVRTNRTRRFRMHSYADPHRYRYEPRGYYPYYNSGYWKSRRHVYRPRYKFHHPRYRSAWGKHKRRYHHRSWHNRNHGRHRFWHW